MSLTERDIVIAAVSDIRCQNNLKSPYDLLLDLTYQTATLPPKDQEGAIQLIDYLAEKFGISSETIFDQALSNIQAEVARRIGESNEEGV